MKLYDVVLCIDTSYSVRSRDFPPNRLSVLKELALRIVDYILSKEPFVRIGIVCFYMYAYPIIDLTRNRDELVEAINSIEVMGEATAPGEAVKEAIKMFKIQSPPTYRKRLIFVTDGTFNEGVPLSIIAEYAKRCNVRIDICSFGRLSDFDREEMEKTVKITNGRWEYAKNTNEIVSTLLSLLT